MRTAEYRDDSAEPISNDGDGKAVCQAAPRTSFRACHLEEGRLLLQLGIGKPLIARMMLLADTHDTSVEAELLASGQISEAIYFEALAEKLALPFLPTVDQGQVLDVKGLDTQLRQPEMMRIHHSSRPPITVVAPRLNRLAALKARLEEQPALRKSLAISTPSVIRNAVWQAGGQRRVEATTQALFEAMPLYSARITFWGKQGFYTGLLTSLMVASAMLAFTSFILLLHIVLSVFYLLHFSLRLKALLHAFRQKSTTRSIQPAVLGDGGGLPVYSVFVALYQETEVVEQLVAGLNALDWPRSRLDIKLICEADDTDTISALKALNLPPEYEIVLVPVRMPRTKPKALTYALAGARGTFLTVYDAEDRPSPGQLREAHAAFAQGPDHLGCLQAPLIITNARQSWLSSLFALEYAGLFRGMLPMLAAQNLPLPLGGTSNHFRTETLRSVGAWDPYNVTEDADLGIRLHRLGYRSGVLTQPTFEDAPIDVDVWLAQRARWFKGWLQTWLLMMRDPSRLASDMGLSSFIVSQILIAGMLMSALCHPVILAFLAYVVFQMFQAETVANNLLALWLFVLDIVNVFGSYAVFIALGRNPMTPPERRAIGWRWMSVPLYWLIMSLAAWKAVIELKTRPFSWNKTPHKPTL